MLWGRIRYRRRDSVPAFASYYMGASLYHWSGLQDYIERLYGIRHDELALQLNEQTLVRIRDYTPMKLLAHKARQLAGRAPPRTMLVRPRGGFTEVWNMSQKIWQLLECVFDWAPRCSRSVRAAVRLLFE